MTEATIKATIGDLEDTFELTHRFSPQEVAAHNKVSWDGLGETEKRSLAEDYALWFFFRRYGDQRELRVEVVLPE